MSDYHVLDINTAGDRARVAFHFAVPNETNAANVQLSTALVQYLAPSTDVPFLAQPESDAIAAGTVYEHVETVQFDANANNAAKRAVLDNRWSALNSKIPDQLRTRLKFWGTERDVP